jgi:hypothetical protein
MFYFILFAVVLTANLYPSSGLELRSLICHLGLVLRFIYLALGRLSLWT